MPEIKHTFNAGRMNKDLDERLVPNGEYRDALNIQVSGSEGSDMGAAQNILGNRAAYDVNPPSITNGQCIGVIADTENEKIYWFISGSAVDCIAEYDQLTQTCAPVLVDVKGSGRGILKFSKQYYITGINLIDGMLFWVDDKNEPRCINIQKFKGNGSTYGSVNFSTHTTLLPRNGLVSDKYNFTEDDITVIKRGPSTAPTLTMYRSERSAVLGTEVITNSVATIDFSKDNNGAELINKGDSEGFIVYNNPNWEVGDELILTAGEDDNGFEEEWTIRLIITTFTPALGNHAVIAEVLSIDENTPLTATQFTIKLKQKAPMFEDEFVRFAYRWKYKDGEYSCISPYSQVAFLAAPFEYWPKKGHNTGMQNQVRSLAVKGFVPIDGNLDWNGSGVHQKPFQVEEVEVLMKKDNDQNIYSVKNIKYGDPEWTSTGILDIKSELIYKVLPSNQSLRPWDSVPKTAKAQEFVANRIVYGNYTQNYDLITANGNDADPQFDVWIDPAGNSADSEALSTELSVPGVPSIKSMRKYQLGIVYIDAYGRETPIQTHPSAGFTMDKASSGDFTKINATVTGAAPLFAKSYKFFIKETASEYYNLAQDRWYDAEDGNVWLSFPSSERNKVTEETYLQLKKGIDENEPITVDKKYRIIAIKNEAPLELKETRDSKGIMTTNFDATGFPQQLTTHVDVDQDDWETRFGENSPLLQESDLEIRIVSNGPKSKWYKLQGISLNGTGATAFYRMPIDGMFGTDVDFASTDGSGTPSSAAAGLGFELAKITSKNKKEFSGRFFAKIERDSFVNEHVTATANNSTLSIFLTHLVTKWKSKGDSSTQTAIVDGGVGPDDHYLRWSISNHTPCGYDGHCFDFSNMGGDGSNFFGPCDGKYGYDETASFDYLFGPADTLGGYEPKNLVKDRMVNAQGDRFYIHHHYDDDINEAREDDADVDFINSLTTIGTKFRFKSDTAQEVYTVEHWAWFGGQFYKCNKDWKSSKMLTFGMKLDKPLSYNFYSSTTDYHRGEIEILKEYETENTYQSQNPAIWETVPKESIDTDIFYEIDQAHDISTHGTSRPLNWHNCYSFGNGVESNRISDDFNAPTIAKGVKASMPLAEQYKTERRKSGLIYSGLYNSTSGINSLNQFIAAEAITKDLNPEYGSIQKLNQRDTDLTVLCEDKCLKVLANKDALYEASGNPQLTATNRVLGQATPYVGDFGISKNPESFASYGFRAYFTDKARGAVMRLSRDGLTAISEHGMRNYFKDKLAESDFLLGTFDDTKKLYNLTCLQSVFGTHKSSAKNDTISFKEQVKGWTSRKSFLPEAGVSLNNIYYTFKSGEMWAHDFATRNTFYGAGYRYQPTSTSNFEGSSITVVLNDSPEVIKSFKTISYEGTQGRVLQEESDSDNTVYNITGHDGWHVESMISNKQTGYIPEFIEKEGKWFNYIKGEATYFNSGADNNLDSKEFNVQGIGVATNIQDTSAPTQVTITIKEN